MDPQFFSRNCISYAKFIRTYGVNLKCFNNVFIFQNSESALPFFSSFGNVYSFFFFFFFVFFNFFWFFFFFFVCGCYCCGLVEVFQMIASCLFSQPSLVPYFWGYSRHGCFEEANLATTPDVQRSTRIIHALTVTEILGNAPI